MSKHHNADHYTDAELDLPGARRELRAAINALIDHTTALVDGQTHFGDSLYQQLRDNLTTPQAATSRRHAASQPPIWVDAADLLNTIDTMIGVWQPDPGIFDGDLTREPTPETVRRLNVIREQNWRPQDVHGIEQMTGILRDYASDIRELLDPTPKITLPNPCPACNTSIVYRRDSAGETVRQPALRIGPNGCECQKCRTVWAPDYFTHLARVLGYDMPAGVLE